MIYTGQFTVEDVAKLVSTYVSSYLPGYATLKEYYEGTHAIAARTVSDSTKPNHKIGVNYPEYVTSIKSGYFLGTPVRWTSEDEDLLQKVLDDYDYNDISAHDMDLARISSVYGHAYEILEVSQDASKVILKSEDPTHLCLLTDEYGNTTGALRIYDQTGLVGTEFVTRRLVDVYTPDYVYNYSVGQDAKWELLSIYTNWFKVVPVIQYANNASARGDWQDEISLIDAYDLVVSDDVNDVAYVNEAYLLLKNLSATTPDDITKMRENRVMLVQGDGDAQWLIKDINDAYRENIKTRLAKEILKQSKCPDLGDESFSGNLSGVAIKYKLYTCEMDTAGKERMFARSFRNRHIAMCNFYALKGNVYDPYTLVPTFIRNLPANDMETVQMAMLQKDVVSTETLLSMLPGIDDVAKEMDRIKAERKANPPPPPATSDPNIPSTDPDAPQA